MAEDRFARTAARYAARQDERAGELAGLVHAFVAARGDEHALDVGCGSGALALALAPVVRDVVGVDRVPELLALARDRAPANATFVEADATALPFESGEFDLAGTLRTLHHVARPELVVDRFERARDPGHARLLPEGDLRALFEANGLVLIRDRRDVEQRPLAAYLDLAGCEGEAREQAIGLAPHGPDAYTAVVGWYLLERRLP